MRYYEDEGYRDDDNRKKKKIKHSSNRPGQGMRILNIEAIEDIDEYVNSNYSYDNDDELTTYNAKRR